MAKRLRLESLESSIESAKTSFDGMPKVRGVASRVEEITIKIISLKESIEKDTALLKDVREETSNAIDSLSNENYKTIFDMRYLQYEPWDEIAAVTSYSESHVMLLHREGLKLIHIPEKYLCSDNSL